MPDPNVCSDSTKSSGQPPLDKAGMPAEAEMVIEAGPFAERQRFPRIAVLGVHGIAHHDAGATANAMADLLLSLPAYNPDHPTHVRPREYDAFRSVGVQIPLQPVRTEKHFQSRQHTSVFEERSLTFAKQTKQYRAQNLIGWRGDVGDAFTNLLLEDYRGGADGDAYITTRLEGKRLDPGREAEVHIYEVLWADLARPYNSFLSFFVALFQLILHLGSLSRLALDTGAAENSGPLWVAYRSVQRYAVRILQIVLPLLKVILLIALIACIPAVSDKLKDALWLPPLLGAAGGLAVGFIVAQKKRKGITSSPWVWAVHIVLPAMVGAVVGQLLAFGTRDANAAVAGNSIASLLGRFSNVNQASAIECWIVFGGTLLYYVLGKYEDIRSGVEVTGWTVYLLCFAGFASTLLIGRYSVEQATFWTAEWIIAVLRASWWVMIALALSALVLGSMAWRSIRQNDGKQARARAAVRTSRFAFGLPALLFALVTAVVWAAMFYVAKQVRDPFFNLASLQNGPCWQHWLAKATLIPDPTPMSGDHLSGAQLQVRGDYLKWALAWSIGYQSPLSLALFLLALFLLGAWVLPGVLTERIPPRNKQEPPRNSTNLQSLRLGAWLSRGLDATSVSTFLFWTAIFVLPWAYYLLSSQWQSSLEHATFRIIIMWIVPIAAAALATMVRYGSSILSAILDVDTYLRTSPTYATPRAKIFERYVSMLRYLAHYRGPDGRGYDAIVIVAHSLGSLISADLLHFLNVKGDPELQALGFGENHEPGAITLKLLTMGNPTRQLLNRFFPYLYDWIRGRPDNGLQPLPAPALTAPKINAHALPDPGDLGVAQWVNMYRSGDYVGRSIWLDEWYCRTDPANNNDGKYPHDIYQASNGSRAEMCIGAGAHTHYWDDTAPDVAEQLNRMIGQEILPPVQVDRRQRG